VKAQGSRDNWVAANRIAHQESEIIMNKVDIARALKDTAYRASLTAEELALLPANAAGVVELSDDALLSASGGRMATTERTNGTLQGPCCP
jgi:mersacidin/lichenicidin family type 2 lantibiotic